MMHFIPYVKGIKNSEMTCHNKLDSLWGDFNVPVQLLHLVGAGAGIGPPGSGPLKTVQ